MPFMYNVIIRAGGALSKENLTNQINGTSSQFTISENIEAGSLRVYWNGIRQIELNSFNELSSNTFQTSFTPLSGDTLVVEYIPEL